MKKTIKWGIVTGIAVVLLIVSIVLVMVGNSFATAINVALNVKTQKVVEDPNAKVIYTSDYENEADLVSTEEELCRTLSAEGSTLLLNNNKTLPFAQGTTFSLFSQSSRDLLYGGTGSGHMDTSSAITLKEVLEEQFGEGSVNSTLWDFYTNSGFKRENAVTTGGNMLQYRINEVPWDKYTDDVKKSFENYGDAAIVVLSRSGGEGADLPSSEESLSKYLTAGDYLQLCKEEKDLLENLKQYKEQGIFKKIVVLLNYSNPVQLDFLKKYDIDAALWIGDVGQTGIRGVADILSGKVNPSGRLVDSFLKDNHSSPAMQNFGAYLYTNGTDYGVAFAQNNTAPGADKGNANYVVYQEGIYVGYRYYETRYEDYVLGQGNAGDYVYNDCVAYPFGYGLSYTDFKYSDFKVEEQGDTFDVSVDVTNTGNVDGKHTVQIYFQSPYTQYDIDNQVEKSSVELCGFDKKEIKAGETQNYTISVKKEELASYDSNGAKTYILDAGDYYFTAGKDAHDAVNNILMAKSKDGVSVDTNRMSGTGNADLVKRWNNKEFDTKTYATSSATGYKITNQFDHVDLNKYEGTADQTILYLTRNDWTGTFPQKTVSLAITEQMWKDGLSHNEKDRAALAEKYAKLYYGDVTKVPQMGVPGDLVVASFTNTPIDDDSWNTLISQIPYSEMTNLIYNGFHMTQPVLSINLIGTLDENGPQGFTRNLMGGTSGMSYTSEDIMAATYNIELINQLGKCIGEDFLHASTVEKCYTGIYGPGANIHRTPYSGRNFEYFSEDGYLSGVMCAAEVAGIQDKGVYVFTKHFALNDQEEGRMGISTWANEQTIREIYLRGFEGSVRGGGLGVMTSFNRLGVVWSGADHGLMTEVLRNEWGMEGAATTDCSVMAKYMDCRLGLLAGQDIWDGYSASMATLDNQEGNAAIVTAAQQATKRIAFSISRSHLMNNGNAHIVLVREWWKILNYVLIGVFALITIGSIIMLVRSIKKEKSEK